MVEDTGSLHFDNVALFLDGFAQWVSQAQLHKVLQLSIDVPANSVHEDRLHA